MSRLFARKRPAGLSANSTPEELFAAFRGGPDPMLFRKNLEDAKNLLVKKHKFG